MIKNYGFRLSDITQKDFVLGAERSAPFEVVNESGQWTSYLPEGETQVRQIETSSCTAFGTLNQIEILANQLYSENENYSERYQAIVSGQDRFGNDPQKVYDSILKSGLISEILHPFGNEIADFNEYLSPKPMSRTLLAEGKKWLERFSLKHEYLFHQQSSMNIAEKQRLLLQGLKRSPIACSVLAWRKDGELYVKEKGEQDTHWCVIVGYVENEYWLVLDSYAAHSEFIKKLAWDYDFQVTKGIWLHRYTEAELLARQRTLLDHVLNLLKIISTLFSVVETITPKLPPAPPVVEKEEKPKVEDLAQAIERYESVRKDLNNPGGLRSSPFQNGFIVQATTGKKLATFATYEAGWQALIHQIRIACLGTSPAYTREAKKLGIDNCAELSIGQFISIYAPKTENDTELYIRFIEQSLNTKRSLTMKELL